MKEGILHLLHKYDMPIPRYTSYPTVPYWAPDSINPEKWMKSVMDTFINEKGALSIYIHLPFCENLCTFCACNKRITKNHKVEDRYTATVLKEWSVYRKRMPFQPVIKEIHLGGGTPTFFNPENLTRLIEGITHNSEVPVDQRRYTEADLPGASDKWAIYHTGRALLTEQGFVAIGMDHFALPGDKLCLAASEGKMHRNFMGYTTTINKLIIGLGASSISDSWNAFVQNEKTVEDYQDKIEKGEWPYITGHFLNAEDLILRKRILELMCTNRTILNEDNLDQEFLTSAI